MEKLSDELQVRCEALRRNYEVIEERLTRAAEQSGRKREEITLLAATKTVPVEVINYGVSLGIDVIGENRVQEFLSKVDALSPCTRHMIGHLQTNKVRQIVGKVRMIQSVDSVRLAQEIDRLSQQQGCTTEVLLEVNIGREQNKSGVLPEELERLLEAASLLPGLRVRGLMAIPPICEKKEEIRKYFSAMRELFIDIRTKTIDNVSMDVLSMGMSDDYAEAVLEGANMVRIGSALFGARNYQNQ